MLHFQQTFFGNEKWETTTKKRRRMRFFLASLLAQKKATKGSGFGTWDTTIQKCFPTLRIFKRKKEPRKRIKPRKRIVYPVVLASTQFPLHIYVYLVRIRINVNELNACIWESEWCSIRLCNAIRFFMHALLYFYCSRYTPMCWSGLLP